MLVYHNIVLVLAKDREIHLADVVSDSEGTHLTSERYMPSYCEGFEKEAADILETLDREGFDLLRVMNNVQDWEV